MGLLLAGLAFVASFLCGTRSLGLGMTATLSAGWFYGILRARYPDGFSHFIFDAAVFGLYVARFTRPGGLEVPVYARPLWTWLSLLLGWPFVVFALCLIYPHHPLIQLIGLRAAVWFLPFLLLGACANGCVLTQVARTLAFLNLAALAFALGEYVLGLERFYPRSPVTDLIYRSNDIAGYTAYRIPGTFPNSASYGGVMAATVPLLIGRWQVPAAGLLEKVLMLSGLLAAALGIFLCGSRTPVLFLFVLGLLVAYQLRARVGSLVVALAVTAAVAYFVSSSERLQRFASLQDHEIVTERIAVSAHAGVLDLLLEYPMGAGLGSAFGTSIPSFLQHLAPEPIGGENEYARIGLEQGLVGLCLWIGFIAWTATRSPALCWTPWRLGGRLMFTLVLLCWMNALLGVGLLTAIPGTALVLFQMGAVARARPEPRPRPTWSATPAAVASSAA